MSSYVGVMDFSMSGCMNSLMMGDSPKIIGYVPWIPNRKLSPNEHMVPSQQ